MAVGIVVLAQLEASIRASGVINEDKLAIVGDGMSIFSRIASKHLRSYVIYEGVNYKDG